MSTCNVCEIKITRNRPLSINDNTCSECFPKINDDNTDDDSDYKESEVNDIPDLISITASGKKHSINLR